MPDHFIKKFLRSLPVFFFLLIPVSWYGSIAQCQDTSSEKDTIIVRSGKEKPAPDTAFRDPQKAALYAAVLPGMGQIYNKKYWKLPIVYVGFGTFGYYINRNSRYYKDLKSKLLDSEYELKYFDGIYTDDQLEQGMEIYKRWRDLSIIGTVGFYVFQIIDATVDAYLFDWDVGEDIAFRIEPGACKPVNNILPMSSFGLRACISF